MSRLPRIAIGGIHADTDFQPIYWALLESLQRCGTHVQTFLSQARFVPSGGVMSITGQAPRHLDSWLMSRDVCREIFFHGSHTSDLSVVEGCIDSLSDSVGGQLTDLCEWLDLPRIGVVDARRIDACRLPRRPREIDAVLIDGYRDAADFYRLQTTFNTLWGVPVVGALPDSPRLRSELNAVPHGDLPGLHLVEMLGDAFETQFDLKRLLSIADDRSFQRTEPKLFLGNSPSIELNVAVAYDAAFHCYFQDTLDLLEMQGATIRAFSPLRDERLPRGTDMVFLGCGNPERHTMALTQNHCMLMALRNHISAGGRVYAEGGGLAYLCQHVETGDGQLFPMVGAFPASARFNANPTANQPVEIELRRNNWLGEAGSRIRGYRNDQWQLEPTGSLTGQIRERDHRFDVVARHQAIGSHLHLDFAAQPAFLRSFFQPHQSAPDPTRV